MSDKLSREAIHGSRFGVDTVVSITPSTIHDSVFCCTHDSFQPQTHTLTTHDWLNQSGVNDS